MGIRMASGIIIFFVCTLGDDGKSSPSSLMSLDESSKDKSKELEASMLTSDDKSSSGSITALLKD